MMIDPYATGDGHEEVWTCDNCNYMNSGPVCTKCEKVPVPVPVPVPKQTDTTISITRLIREFNEHLESSSTNVSHTKEQLDGDPELAERVRGMGKPDPLEYLRRLEALRQEAYEGPWNAGLQNEPSDFGEVFLPSGQRIHVDGDNSYVSATCEFIAAARNTDLQPAIDEIERLRAEIKRLQSRLHESKLMQQDALKEVERLRQLS